MLDLSNNNGVANFVRVYAAGQRRIYLKRSEGNGFIDRTFPQRRQDAQRAGLKVGAYHFARPHEHTPAEEARFFLSLLPPLRRGPDLRPCLDLEEAVGAPGVGRWAAEFCRLVEHKTGVLPIIYSYASYVEACAFPRAIAPLWLAAYSRNDGREYPFAIPHPWKRIVAHQFSSQARVIGLGGFVDISHVFNYGALEVPRRWQRTLRRFRTR